MAIVDSEIQLFLSGGGANADPNASLGGAISTTQIDSVTTLHNLFDKVTSAETTAGITEYRCFYVKNTNGTLTWESVVAWIGTNTPSGDTSVEIAIGSSGVNGTEPAIADEIDSGSVLSGLSFSAPATQGAALAIGDIPSDQHMAIWVKRVVNPGASAYSNDGATINFAGDTAA